MSQQRRVFLLVSQHRLRLNSRRPVCGKPAGYEGHHRQNGGEGVSNIGLRNMGPARTLILIDGQRLIPVMSSNSTTTVPDLNAVPMLKSLSHLPVVVDPSRYGWVLERGRDGGVSW